MVTTHVEALHFGGVVGLFPSFLFFSLARIVCELLVAPKIDLSLRVEVGELSILIVLG